MSLYTKTLINLNRECLQADSQIGLNSDTVQGISVFLSLQCSQQTGKRESQSNFILHALTYPT